MALFEEQKIEGGKYEPIKISELSKGESIAIYFGGLEDRKSQELGDFKVVAGLSVDLSASSADKLVETAYPASFVPNTMIQHLIDQGGFTIGKLYRIQKKWDRGEIFADGAKAKGYGYEVFELKADGKTISALKQKFLAPEEQIEPGKKGGKTL